MLCVMCPSSLEVLALKGLTKLPVAWGDVPGGCETAVACSNPEGERLPDQHGVGLPFLAPRALHCSPRHLVALHLYTHDITSSAHIPHHHLVEVRVPGYGESDPSLLLARNPAVLDRDDAGSVVLGQLSEDGLGDVKVLAGRVAPSAVVAGLVVIGRAEVGGRDEERRLAKLAPLRVIGALYLVARPTRLPIVEQCCAQRRRLKAVALLHHVLITAGSPKCAGATLIKGGMSLLPRAWRELGPVMLSKRRPRVVVYGMDMSPPMVVVMSSVSDRMVSGMSPRGGMMRMMISDCGIRNAKIGQRRGNDKQ